MNLLFFVYSNIVVSEKDRGLYLGFVIFRSYVVNIMLFCILNFIFIELKINKY